MKHEEKCLLVIAGFLLLIYGMKEAWLGNGGDMIIYLNAGELLRNGQAVYHTPIFTGAGTFLNYSYSPFFAGILVPFTYFPVKFIYTCWVLLDLFLLYRIYGIISSFLKIKVMSAAETLVFTFFLLLFSFRYILYNFDMMQMTIVLLYLCLEGFLLITRSHNFGGSMLIALGICIKLLPLVMVPYLVMRGKFKATALTLIFVVVFTFLPVIYLGPGKFNETMQEWWTVINPSNPEFVAHQNSSGEGVHSLSALIPAYFGAPSSYYDLDLKRNIMDLSTTGVRILLNITRAFFILLTFAFLKKPWFKGETDQRMFYELSYILLITPLVFPHQQKYAFIFLAPAIAWIIAGMIGLFRHPGGDIRRKRASLILMSVSFVLLVLTTNLFIGKHFFMVAQYYKMITWGTLLIIPVLWMFRPEAGEKKEAACAAPFPQTK
ncbi:MAG TPA: glycosyltransferase family 87 protein [Bacteroidales bacterium]|nr:glycosyltransferase family 87 protein [Bacteroidales bacterium]HPS74320.1 glycosyltransferase family 87 protein [Bacteroidales bacterium]